jgi:aldose 1-epimerase
MTSAAQRPTLRPPCAPDASPRSISTAQVDLGAGQPKAECVSLHNGAGIHAQLSSYGASLVSLTVPNRAGRGGEVVLGFAEPNRYTADHPFFGSTIGRFANRIGGARFMLDGQGYALEANDGKHHLHGGSAGFHRQGWRTRTFADDTNVGVTFSRTSPDGEGGYPGALRVTVSYRLSADGALGIDFEAETSRTTVVNMTHHSYFNLRDGGAHDVLDHRLWLTAERYLAIDTGGVPTGEALPVASTALDFRTPRALGDAVGAPALLSRGGYDHCFLLADNPTGTPMLAARLHDPHSGRVLDVLTTQPALQLYTGNNLDGSLVGHGGTRYARHTGVCLETQHCPDAPNRPEFASTRLEPGQRYAHSVVYRFSVCDGSIAA